ncbi:acyl-CoA dehydrogenase family protein [Maritimibacter dapengensis]|uniref:Acyl-CoA/acyl-ACP dehydrogenase n=1 Tax=Maritimibacter dapengensis TaxID=2836868 RepID=A0ABS6T5I2_9RHOB|nr:acyl-CoA dehydrogenase family protein [Maritimibacter dapengensis]MBV7379983.1 acyl-CoA/acyl-ACP dehydrogenase [Maritimibacter dapengensis]
MSFDLTPSDDLRQILDAAQTMLDTHYPVARLRDGSDDSLAALDEFGAFDLARPDTEGGAGFTLVEEAHLHVALGRHLAPPAALATAIARRIDPTATAALGFSQEDAWLWLPQPDTAQALIRVGNGLTLAPAKATETTPALGGTYAFAKAPPSQNARRADAATHLVAQVLTSAQLLGVAIGARDLALAYARDREQFGRPIASFQAIKHRAADMSIGIEKVSALLDMAAIATRDASPDAGFLCSALARLAPRTTVETARGAIQIHGGIGFSAEADAHLFLKRAHILRAFLGPDDMLEHKAPLAPY